MREAPSIRIIQGLRRRGYKVRAFDPVAMPVASRMKELRGVEFMKDAVDAARGAHAVAIVTEWNEFRNMNLGRLKRVMKKPVLCDLRNIYDRDEVERAGITHVGVGRGRATAAKTARRAASRRRHR
jgi:UDPglucose 6-dehydrogenase